MDKKYALITGASGGIGLEICKMLFEQDYFLYLNVRNESSATRLISKLKQLGGECRALIFDIRDNEKIIKEIASIKKIDLLVNNAGILRDNLIYSTPLKDWLDVVDTNFYAVDNFYRNIKRLLSKNSTIINLCSISGIRPRSGQVSYGTSKSMLIQWTKCMAKLEPEKNFYAISPGPVDTALIKNTPWYKDEQYLSKIPLGRYAKPEEIANFIRYIINDTSLFRSGENIVLDGGFIKKAGR